MTGWERNILDAPGCPFLGLAGDARSHFTFPHPAHRCYTEATPTVVTHGNQATLCLNPRFVACNRYQARQRRDQQGGRAGLPPGSAAGSTTPRAAAAQPTRVIHVFRSGDTLPRIAAAYGVSVQQIATANGVTDPDAVRDGERLVIPLGQLDTSAAGGVGEPKGPIPGRRGVPGGWVAPFDGLERSGR